MGKSCKKDLAAYESRIDVLQDDQIIFVSFKCLLFIVYNKDCFRAAFALSPCLLRPNIISL